MGIFARQMGIRNPQSGRHKKAGQKLHSLYINGGMRFVPDRRTNRVILIVPDERLAEIKRMIGELDQQVPQEGKQRAKF